MLEPRCSIPQIELDSLLKAFLEPSGSRTSPSPGGIGVRTGSTEQPSSQSGSMVCNCIQHSDSRGKPDGVSDPNYRQIWLLRGHQNRINRHLFLSPFKLHPSITLCLRFPRRPWQGMHWAPGSDFKAELLKVWSEPDQSEIELSAPFVVFSGPSTQCFYSQSPSPP